MPNLWNIFRWTGYLEASSFLALLFIAMPLKYFWGKPELVKIVGMAHGILFLMYVVVATWLAIRARWSKQAVLYAYAASMIPMGPFIFDRWLMRTHSRK